MVERIGTVPTEIQWYYRLFVHSTSPGTVFSLSTPSSFRSPLENYFINPKYLFYNNFIHPESAVTFFKERSENIYIFPEKDESIFKFFLRMHALDCKNVQKIIAWVSIVLRTVAAPWFGLVFLGFTAYCTFASVRELKNLRCYNEFEPQTCCLYCSNDFKVWSYLHIILSNILPTPPRWIP